MSNPPRHLALVSSASSTETSPEPADRGARANRSDADLVRQAFERHHGMVYGTAMSLLANPSDAEDVTQAVFETLCDAIETVRVPDALAGFLKTTTTRRCLALLKRRHWWLRRRGVQARELLAMRGATVAPPDLLVATSELLDALTPEQRVVVVLKLAEKQSYEEIAGRLRVSVPTVRRRLASARTRLRAVASTPTQRELLAEIEESP
jgi:RNA polymerase sigma-70 factor (ECF subfamily)